MGQKLSHFYSNLGRFFEYPVKMKPICFYRQDDFTATGENNRRRFEKDQECETTEYDRLVDLFYTRLAEQRQIQQDKKDQDNRSDLDKNATSFPGWTEATIANLHSLFLLFGNQANGMMGFEEFCAVLESLGDANSMELRKVKFIEADLDNDGWITYEEFLELVYEFNVGPERGQLVGLAALCNEVAADIQFVSKLTVGEQLEYGLF